MTGQELTLEQQLAALVLDVTAQQSLIDASWCADVDAYTPLLQLARRAGADALGRALVPPRQVMTQADIDVRLFVAHRRGSAMAVSLAGLGLQKRVERSAHVQLRIQCTVLSRPIPAFGGSGGPAGA